MNTLRGIIKRVIRREGRVGRIWLMSNENPRLVNRWSSRILSARLNLQQRYASAGYTSHGGDVKCELL